MLTIKPIQQLNELSHLKKIYFSQSTSPLDGMWHFGFVAMADHYGFYEHERLIGFCCINSDKYLLQFYLAEDSRTQAQELFTLIVNNQSAVIGEVNGAFVSSAEPWYLSLCLDNSSTFMVNALMYQYIETKAVIEIEDIKLSLADDEQLPSLVSFAVEAIGAPVEWLTGYFSNLINRKELWYYLLDGKIVATGECRRFDEYQIQYADLGMIVSSECRGLGIGTKVLKQLLITAKEQQLKAICSTEKSNISAQKAMTKVGFVADNRIVQFDFPTS